MSFAYPGKLVREILVDFSRSFVVLEVKNFRDRIQRGLIKSRAYVVFGSTGHDDPEGMWRGDEGVKEAKEVCSLFLVPTFVEPIYNKNSGGLWWDRRSVFQYKLLCLQL
jgi:hypothetical protein